MPAIPAPAQRRSETPNAAMTTLASPTQGGSALAVWTVAMEPGAQGPVHHFDREQVWTVLEGAAVVDLAGDRLEVGPGDALVLPAEVVRRITADAERGLRALACAPAGARATDGDGVDRGVPPWIA